MTEPSTTLRMEDIDHQTLEALKGYLSHHSNIFSRVRRNLPNVTQEAVDASLQRLSSRGIVTYIEDKRGWKLIQGGE